jgi:hypothetical protein
MIGASVMVIDGVKGPTTPGGNDLLLSLLLQSNFDGLAIPPETTAASFPVVEINRVRIEILN